MCYHELNSFTGCGCVKAGADVVLDHCPIAKTYGRACPEFQCGPDPRSQPTERFGLVCMDCLEGGKSGRKSGGKQKRSRK